MQPADPWMQPTDVEAIWLLILRNFGMADAQRCRALGKGWPGLLATRRIRLRVGVGPADRTAAAVAWEALPIWRAIAEQVMEVNLDVEVVI